MNKTYALRIKLPDGSDVGDLYKNDGHGYYNTRLHANAKGIDEQHRWDTWQVEDNPNFFVLYEEEKPFPKYTDFFNEKEWQQIREKGGTFVKDGFEFTIKPYTKKEEEKIVISHLRPLECELPVDGSYEFCSSKEIPPEKFPAIIKAIEFIVNGGQVEDSFQNQRVPFIKDGEGELHDVITENDSFKVSYEWVADTITVPDEVECVTFKHRGKQIKYTLQDMLLCDQNAYWRGVHETQNSLLSQMGKSTYEVEYKTFEDYINSLYK